MTTLEAPILNEAAVERIRNVPNFARWIEEGDNCEHYLARGQEITLEAGEYLVHEGDPAAFFMVLEGELRVLKKVSDAEMLLATHQPGAFFGELPLIMGTPFVAAGQATAHVVVYRLDEATFWAMLSACNTITREIVSVMARRIQNLEALSQTREKLVSLGTMAAGLAHELNNPASASQRAAAQLRETTREVEMRAIRLYGLQMQPLQCDIIKKLRTDAMHGAEKPPELSAMARADREDAIADWLDDHDVTEGYKYAPTFVQAGLDEAWLNALAEQVSCDVLSEVLGWLEASLRADALIIEIEKSSASIAHLVGAVKSYSHLDRAPKQEIDLHDGLDSTLTMLKYKLRGIDIQRDYDRSIPCLVAYGSELNQVWTNLLDNAADALQEKDKVQGDKPRVGAQIRIATHYDALSDSAIIKICDNGSGIPEAVRNRIFEPFFTTKEVGKGTGLGLEIAHRIIVGRHEGDITIDTGSNGTTFKIRLPIKFGHKHE